MKKELKELVLNKELIINESHKKTICSAEGGRYYYFDFTKEKISEIAQKNFSELEMEDGFYLVQALFPEYLICSGLFDCFVIFEIQNGVRQDPPKYFFRDLISYLNNHTNFNLLCDEIIDLFKKNNIPYHYGWDVFSKEVKERV